MTTPTVPDVNALRRPTVHLEEVGTENGMSTVYVTLPGDPIPKQWLAPPEVVDYLRSMLNPANVFTQVAALVDWAANAMESSGKPVDAAAVHRVASWLNGLTSTPLDGTTTEVVCEAVAPGSAMACGSGNARECRSCGRKFCVKCWSSAAHPCVANRPKRELPPPIVPKPAEGPVVAVLERVASTG